MHRRPAGVPRPDVLLLGDLEAAFPADLPAHSRFSHPGLHFLTKELQAVGSIDQVDLGTEDPAGNPSGCRRSSSRARPRPT